VTHEYDVVEILGVEHVCQLVGVIGCGDVPPELGNTSTGTDEVGA